MRTVAHLLPSHNPFPPVYPAGTELRVAEVARRARRHRPVVVCGHFEGQAVLEDAGAMRVQRIRIGRAYRRLFQKLTRLDPLPYAARMWRIVGEERASLIHIHNEPKLLAGLLPYLEDAPIPVIVHVANEKPIARAGRSRVECWVAASRYIADWLEREGIPANRVRVIYTGVDVAARRPAWEIAEERRAALRARFGIEDSRTRVILFAGRLVKEKGVNELLDAFEVVRARASHPVALLLAGNVRESRDPRNEKAVYGRAAVARINAMEGVRYAGSLHPEAMHDFLLAGDVFALPSLWHDPFPTVMLEAAAAGLPIVAAARGGMREFLEGCDQFEFVARPEDPGELASALLGYVESPGAADAAGRWLRAKAESRFGWQRVADEFDALYDELLVAERARA